jgi:hypothetical protein
MAQIGPRRNSNAPARALLAFEAWIFVALNSCTLSARAFRPLHLEYLLRRLHVLKPTVLRGGAAGFK